MDPKTPIAEFNSIHATQFGLVFRCTQALWRVARHRCGGCGALSRDCLTGYCAFRTFCPCSPSTKMPPKSRAKASQIVKRSGLTAHTADATCIASGSLVPNWPPLQPLIPAEDIWAEILLQDQIILIRKLFTPSLCRNYVSFLSSLPLTTTPAKPKEGNAVRINDRFEVHDAGFAQHLWSSTCLAHVLTGLGGAEKGTSLRPDELMNLWGGELCGLNPRIRVYRYRKGHRFGPHCRFTRITHHHPGWCMFILTQFLIIYLCAFTWNLSTN